MSNETVNLYLQQGRLRFSKTVSKEVESKMVEIREKSPEGTWDQKEIDLLKAAKQALQDEAAEK